ncbi:MAG TPA: hypothetical protein VGN88_09320 [Phycisphaerae bacterium]|jgi:hypothetical protein
MSHFLTIPVNENGIITDQNINVEIGIAALPPFKFTDVFIYSHGWWNTASSAASEYNIFSIGFSKTLQELLVAAPADFSEFPDATFSALAAGIHWPSMISENEDANSSNFNFLQATSFFTMEHRADDVGEHAIFALLRMFIEARDGQPPLRFHLIGHSFGCRVLCSALQTLCEDTATLKKAQDIKAEFNLALIQAATDTDSLGAGKLYADVLANVPSLRVLVTTSQADTALGTWYPRAQKLANLFKEPVPAMGAAGPTGTLAVPVSARISVATSPVPKPTGDFVVADITPLHKAHALVSGPWGGFSGQHSDIYLPEIYELLARFFFGTR